VGTGRNLPFYPSGCQLWGVDLSPEMLGRARERARRLGRKVEFREMDLENLDFPDDSFDTVVSSFVLCTTPDPVRALREISRVCRPEGEMLLLEHGLSSCRFLSRLQRWARPAHLRRFACHLDREAEELARRAGLEVREARRWGWGIIRFLVAGPGKEGR